MPRNTRLRRAAVAVLAALVLPCLAAPARAQGTARSMDIDLSARSCGMGGAASAVVWGDLDHWANPALLGYAQGIRYVHGRSQLVPDFANDVYFNSDVVQVGAGGIGLVTSGKPFDHGGVFLDYGASVLVDAGGNYVGTFGSSEHVRGWGGGISLLRAIETAFPRAPRWSRTADVSVGMMSKHVDIDLAPAAMSGHGETDTRDWGALVRVTPYDGFRDGGPLSSLEVSLGYGDINGHEDAPIVFINEDAASPVTRTRRLGGAIRAAFGRPQGMRGVWADAPTPLVSCVASVDHAWIGTLDHVDFQTNGEGVEVAVMNIASLRAGRYDDHLGQIENWTFGWGLALPLAGVAGAAYDEALWPQAGDAKRVHRRQFSVWIDPLAIARACRNTGGLAAN